MTPRIKFSDLQFELLFMVSDISNRRWLAGWMENCELALWRMIKECKPDDSWGAWGEPVSEEELLKLASYSYGLDGWVAWPKGSETEVFMPMGEWERYYEAHKGDSNS